MFGSFCHNHDLPGSADLEYHQVDIRIVPKARVDVAKGTYHRTVVEQPAYYQSPWPYGQPTGPPVGQLIGGGLPVDDARANGPVEPGEE